VVAGPHGLAELPGAIAAEGQGVEDQRLRGVQRQLGGAVCNADVDLEADAVLARQLLRGGGRLREPAGVVAPGVRVLRQHGGAGVGRIGGLLRFGSDREDLPDHVDIGLVAGLGDDQEAAW